MVNLFFSYSHVDEELRDELEKHLSILKRQGIIDTWHDRRIEAGKNLDPEITQNLEKAHIILLLISSDFLASDYCYDREMTRAMERHLSGDARVIPVILRSCAWHKAPFGELMAVPTDGKPVAKFPSLDEGFLDITNAITKIAEPMVTTEGFQAQPNKTKTQQSIPATQQLRSSNLRVRKEFTDQERDTFKDDAFEYIANYFEGSLEELQRRNEDISSRFKRIDANTFTASIYRNGKKLSECSIWVANKGSFSDEILYSCDGSSNGSFNQALTTVDDGYSLFLKLMMSLSGDNDTMLTMEGAAESFWSILIEPLQGDY